MYKVLHIFYFRALIKSRQKLFFEKLMNSRENVHGDPFMHAMKLTRANNSKVDAYIKSLGDCDDFIEADKLARINRVRSSNQTKSVTYNMINPTFDIHPIYAVREGVEDYLRITFTRFRTSSHRLKIETGRWSRIPRERRMCNCGSGV